MLRRGPSRRTPLRVPDSARALRRVAVSKARGVGGGPTAGRPASPLTSTPGPPPSPVPFSPGGWCSLPVVLTCRGQLPPAAAAASTHTTPASALGGHGVVRLSRTLVPAATAGVAPLLDVPRMPQAGGGAAAAAAAAGSTAAAAVGGVVYAGSVAPAPLPTAVVGGVVFAGNVGAAAGATEAVGDVFFVGSVPAPAPGVTAAAVVLGGRLPRGGHAAVPHPGRTPWTGGAAVVAAPSATSAVSGVDFGDPLEPAAAAAAETTDTAGVVASAGSATAASTVSAVRRFGGTLAGGPRKAGTPRTGSAAALAAPSETTVVGEVACAESVPGAAAVLRGRPSWRVIAVLPRRAGAAPARAALPFAAVGAARTAVEASSPGNHRVGRFCCTECGQRVTAPHHGPSHWRAAHPNVPLPAGGLRVTLTALFSRGRRSSRR